MVAQDKKELKMQKVRSGHPLTYKPLMPSQHTYKTNPGPSWGGHLNLCHRKPGRALGPGIVPRPSGVYSSLSCHLSCCHCPLTPRNFPTRFARPWLSTFKSLQTRISVSKDQDLHLLEQEAWLLASQMILRNR